MVSIRTLLGGRNVSLTVAVGILVILSPVIAGVLIVSLSTVPHPGNGRRFNRFLCRLTAPIPRVRFSLLFLLGVVTVASFAFVYVRYMIVPAASIRINGPVTDSFGRAVQLRLINTSGSRIAVFRFGNGAIDEWVQRRTDTGWELESRNNCGTGLERCDVEPHASITWFAYPDTFDRDSRARRIGTRIFRVNGDEISTGDEGRLVWSPEIDFTALAASRQPTTQEGVGFAVQITPTKVDASGSHVTVTLTPIRDRCSNRLRIRFKNDHPTEDVRILKPLDGSLHCWLMPHYEISVKDERGVEAEFFGRCGLYGAPLDEQWLKYIVDLGPGDQHEEIVYLPHRIPQPGVYEVSFKYRLLPEEGESTPGGSYPNGLWHGVAESEPVLITLR